VHVILNPTVGLQSKLDAEKERGSALKVRIEEIKEAAKDLSIKVAALQKQISDMGEERSKELSEAKLELIRSLAEQESLRRKKIVLKQERVYLIGQLK
jgi:predicted  nucleic acid-binding Zn-ribbon protein